MEIKEIKEIVEIMEKALAYKGYDHEKPFDEFQTNDVVNFKGNDEFGPVEGMHVDTVKSGTVTAYKFFKDTTPGEENRIEITEDSSKFTKLIVKSVLSNDPLTKSINYCNFTLAEHGLRVGQVYDENAEEDVVCEKYGIYKGKLYTKSILKKLKAASLIVVPLETRGCYDVYGECKKEDTSIVELEIDIDGGTIHLPNGKTLRITDTLKARCGEENDIIFFKTPDGYIEDQTVITEFWELEDVSQDIYKLIYSVSK